MAVRVDGEEQEQDGTVGFQLQVRTLWSRLSSSGRRSFVLEPCTSSSSRCRRCVALVVQEEVEGYVRYRDRASE